MGINTRMKKREQVPSSVQLIISDSTAKMIKLNVPHNPGESAVVVAAQLVDISASGCGVEVPYLIPAGIGLEAKIDAATFVHEIGSERKEPIVASCKVASCVMKAASFYRLGLSFVNISPADKALIEDFIKLRERRKDTRWDMSK